jgi:hypothetical protein
MLLKIFKRAKLKVSNGDISSFTHEYLRHYRKPLQKSPGSRIKIFGSCTTKKNFRVCANLIIYKNLKN